jgi:hypothetical protein
VAVPVVRFLSSRSHFLIRWPPNEGRLDGCIAGFHQEPEIQSQGLSVALVLTQHARKMALPLDPEQLLAEGGGQVLGLGRSVVQAIPHR